MPSWVVLIETALIGIIIVAAFFLGRYTQRWEIEEEEGKRCL